MNIKTIVIFQRPGDQTTTGKWVHDQVVAWAKKHNIPHYYYDYIKESDRIGVYDDALFIAIGGDGTMLRAMDVSVSTNKYNFSDTSVIGFNGGNLGFLTEDTNMYMPSKLLDEIRDSVTSDGPHVVLKNRMALSTVIDGKEHFALNEFLFSAGSVSSPLNYQININGRFVAEHMGSGCLVATSSGSTAMSMSAGGAIISPDTNVMQIVPIIPHTLTSRPVVTTGRDTITISSDMDRVDEVVISSDGRTLHTFKENANITIKKADVPARVWYAAGRNFFNVLSTKLKW